MGFTVESMSWADPVFGRMMKNVRGGGQASGGDVPPGSQLPGIGLRVPGLGVSGRLAPGLLTDLLMPSRLPL